MTNRNENLKKINVELEKLTDEQLESISGGNTDETTDDCRFLNVLLRGRPGQCDRYGAARIMHEDHDNEIRKAWLSVGVVTHLYSGSFWIGEGKRNYYSIEGREVSQAEAREHAMRVVGKRLKTSDWDW